MDIGQVLPVATRKIVAESVENDATTLVVLGR